MNSAGTDPTELGRYRILGRIASGGMADVFVGCIKGEAGFERVVAVKRMAPELAEDEEFVAMFLDEAKLAARIRSAHVVQTLDLGRAADGLPYLVMDLVVGASASRLIRGAARQSSEVPPDVAVGILVDACRGLHDAHEAKNRDGTPLGIVHRDVSPHNILVGEDGLTKVADFGIARALGTSSDATRDVLRGKVAYFSPEQARGEALDRRSDVFALGVVAWELLTGERLFRADNPLRSLDHVLNKEIPRADAVREAIPVELATAVARALEREPDDRYATASDFEVALTDAAQASGLQLHPSCVAGFLELCCAADLQHIGTLLRARTSRVGNPLGGPTFAEEAAAPLAETETEVDSPSATIESTTEPIPLFPELASSPPAPPPDEASVEVPDEPGDEPDAGYGTEPSSATRRRVLFMALALIPLAGLGALVATSSDTAKPAAQSAPAAQSVTKGPPSPPSSRDRLRVGTTFFASIPSSHLAPGLFWKLVEPSPNGVKASFLRRIPTVENGGAAILPGGRFEVRWQLLPSLRWSDGTPVRAEDLVMSHRLEPSTHTLEARVSGDDTAVFVWSDHWAKAVEGFEPFPSSVFEPLLASGGREAARSHRATNATPGLGPYRVVDVQIGKHMVIEANPHFAGPPPSIPRVELHCSKDTARLVRQFEAGEIDLIVPNSITVEQAEDLRQRRPDAVHIRPSRHYALLYPDVSHPLLSSVEARQALMTAIDRVALSKHVYGRADLVAHCPVLGLGPGAVKTYAFDGDQAKADLRRLGLAGASLPLYHTKWTVDVKIATLIEEQLEASGVSIERREVARASELVRERRHGGLVLHSLREVGPEVVAAHFNLPELGADYDRTVRHSGFDDWTASLLDREERAIDPVRRAQLRRDLWRAYADRLPVLPLVFLLERVVVDPALRGWDGNPSQPFGAELERWYFVR